MYFIKNTFGEQFLSTSLLVVLLHMQVCSDDKLCNLSFMELHINRKENSENINWEKVNFKLNKY